jgi:hypothetical protein
MQIRIKIKMIKNYIDLVKIKNDAKASIIDSFMRRTFSIKNIKFLFVDPSEYYNIKNSDTQTLHEMLEGISEGISEGYNEIHYTVRILYTIDNKDEYREILKDSFYYIYRVKADDSSPTGDSLSIFISSPYGRDYRLDSSKKENGFISSNFLIEHILYSFNKKLADRDIKIESIKKVYISLSL